MTSRELRHFPLTAEVAIAVLLFLYLPLAVVAWMSFNRGAIGACLGGLERPGIRRGLV